MRSIDTVEEGREEKKHSRAQMQNYRQTVLVVTKCKKRVFFFYKATGLDYIHYVGWVGNPYEIVWLL